MRFTEYISDRYISLMLHIMSMMALSLLLKATGNSNDFILLILGSWWVIIISFYGIDYRRRQRYFKEIYETLSQLEEKYLVADILQKPSSKEDLLHYEVIKMAGKAMIQHIRDIEKNKDDYRDYVEQWVHEVKTPIAAIKLMCDNNKNDVTRKIKDQANKTENFIEQALFYARSNQAEKDYIIKEISLKKCIHEVLIHNKTSFITRKLAVEVGNVDANVFSDEKWVIFILNQIVINALNYGRSQIKISCSSVKDGAILSIEDDGMGILDSEKSRVFEKGFTGTNGRVNKSSTGIGLYLCKKLCQKLGLKIHLYSEVNNFTRVELFFPNGNIQ